MPKATSTKTTKKVRAVVASKVVHVAGTSIDQPTHDEVSTRAYQLFENSGREHGRHAEHWLQAETELRSQG